ncbi:MAG: hypothetical protein ABJG78_16865 [Cyclobacteriaceae bacterium]
MKTLITMLCLASVGLSAQSKKVTELVQLTDQTYLDLEFDFASNIVFKTWDKSEVLVEVEVEINDGEYNDIFTLSSSKTSSIVYIEMDEDMWNKVDKKEWRRNCNWESTINYTVYLPKKMEVDANTISGDYEFEYYGTSMNLKTISGAIDMTIPAKMGLDFRAKTISGEVFSDLDIEFPYGKDGLRQIVGQKVRGRIGNGGSESQFETISGNIYLRKG